jgi:NADH-quinone oxidoreductase subunit L
VHEVTRLDTVLPFAILALPLAGFVVLALFGDWIKRDREELGAGVLACLTVITSFGLAVWTTFRLYGVVAGKEGLRFTQPALTWPADLSVISSWFSPPVEAPHVLEWIGAGSFSVPFSLLVDPLSCVMMLVVTGVGSLIHVYSLGYMAEDEERVRYFSYLNLFTFFMLLLVLAGNLPLMFVGWEGVGLCSYLLIGFWYRKESASAAGLKAFVVNRVGDAGLILGMVFLFHAMGTLDLVDLVDNAGALAHEGMWEFGPATIAGLLLFLGATGKSAQIPLHVWLPDAMEGPTPVSALIHAATMVTAGVYMVARLGPLYSVSETAMTTVAVVGAVTALMAATIALVQTDIKRVLAYSTVSQLGYMFLACGVGAFGVGIFHLYTHAFFKALLFLGSGSVIHALAGEQDMRKMGGLRKRIPWTYWTFLVAALAISGIPPLSGFVSKDEILHGALGTGHPVLFGIGVFTALLTAFYMFRLVFLTFFGSFRGGAEAEHHLHESPWVMLVPLVVLAAGAAAGGIVAIPHVVQPVLRLKEEHLPAAPFLPVGATLTAIAGIVAAYYLYLAVPAVRSRLASAFRPVLRVFEAKFYWDDVYGAFVRRGVVGGSDALLWKGIDVGVIDGAVNGTGSLTRAFAQALRPLQTGIVRHYALMILAGAVALLGWVLWS